MWDRRIDEGNRDDDRDNTEKQKNSVRVQLLFERSVDPKKEFMVCTDAYIEGFGGVLMQEGHVVSYESRKLKEREKNYATRNLELAAIVHAFNIWRHYLLGQKFELRTDHMSLKYFFEAASSLVQLELQLAPSLRQE